MVFASLKPASKGTLDQQWDDVCKQLDALMATYSLNKADVVKQVVFLSGTEAKEPSRQRLHRYHGAVGPSTSFVFQPPADGENIAMEVLAIQGEEVKVEWVTPNLTIVSDSVCRWACVAGIEPQLGLPDSYGQVLSCFRQMRRLLEGAGFHFNQVVRTWLFERGIVEIEISNCGAERQRYQILNDARREFFLHGNEGKPYLFTHHLPPASTGIGMSAGTFVTECLALDVPKGAIEIKPLNNPEQIDAHAYTAEVLERGAAAIKSAPLFSRGMSIRQDYHLLLISGTASIKGQESVHPGDPIAQARTTLENIDLVLRQADASLQNVQQLRVYIKHSPDRQEQAARVDVIKKTVEAAVPRVPKLFLIGDVCRDNLLVEIEAFSFVKAAAPNLSGERKATRKPH